MPDFKLNKGSLSEAKGELEIPEFRLTENAISRTGEIHRAASFAAEKLPLDEVWLLTFTKERERRRNLQNDLMWVFHGQWGKFNGHSAKWAHCTVKRDILLPMKLSAKSKRVREGAQFEAKILDYIVDYEDMTKACYKVIDSSHQPLSLFAEFITEYQRMASNHGCLLESNNQREYDEAVYGYSRKKAA